MEVSISTFFSIASAIAAISSAVYARAQARSADTQANLALTLDCFREFRALLPSRDFIRYELNTKYPDGARGFRQLEKKDYMRVVPVSHFFDNLGLLVRNGLARRELVAEYIGGEVEHLWECLEPFISADRDETAGEFSKHYQGNFKWLSHACGRDAQRKIAIRKSREGI